ncbi:hypothetical protein HDU98_003318 [Podochytrium sp. JEL0797]|nr:hypothetical protein HDU98_003318 [Podochytrium sp. JEL0797]
MTEIQRDLIPALTASTERAKIYGPPHTPKTPSNAIDAPAKPLAAAAGGGVGGGGGGGGDHFLPRVTASQHQTMTTYIANGGGSGPQESLNKHQLSQVNLVLDQMDRLRAVMREKEIEMLKVRHENMILKQIERRQQKEIEQLDVQNHDAPKIIKGLREEILGLKSKIKSYYAQLNSETRKVRSLNDECLKLRDNVTRLETLTACNELLDRETLTKKVAEASEKLTVQDKELSESHRKSDMVEKLLNNENRQLRGKIHNLAAENSFLKDKNRKYMDCIQDKEKEIASLSIYRYNAVHKKVDLVVCKKCEQREKEESELRRKQSILDKIPTIPVPTVSVVDGCSVQVVIMAPLSNPDSHIEYTKLTLKVTTDPTHSTIIKEYSIPVKNVSDVTEEEDKSNFLSELIIDGLASGVYYHFLLVASNEGIEGNVSSPVSLLVDELPESPPKPEIAHSILPPMIQLFLPAYSSQQKASPPLCYQIYHSNDSKMQESFLIGEVAVEVGQNLKFTYNNARIESMHYFKVVAVNTMGVGLFSEISDPIHMDCPPNRPCKPHITKLDYSSIHILTTCEPNGGTEIESWKIAYHNGVENTTVTVKAHGAHNSLDYVVEGLQPGAPYIFNVSAVSQGGVSMASENSDDVNLGKILSALPI